MSKFSRAIGAAKLALHAKSPTLLVVGGVVAMGAAAVIACKQTMELETVLEPHTEYLEKIEKQLAGDPTVRPRSGNPYTAEDATKERYITYGHGATDVVQLYAVPIILFVGGAVMVFRGHHILQQRNAALAVAFTTLKRTFDGYRARVIAEQGHETDQRFMSGSIQEIRNQNGYPQKFEIRDWENSEKDLYNRVFSNATSDQWQNDLGANKHFIATQQRFAQQLLNHQGYIYLSDVYKSLGLAESDTSRVCGWKITTMPDGTRYIPIVDFGIDKPLSDDWKYNQERAVYLDFNCQGLIVGGKLQKILENA